MLAIAHRGGDVPAGCENTMAAFQHAVDLGFRAVETDVHLSADGVLVCLHDATLDRVTDARGPVAARTWAELDGVRVGGREPLARFDELLAAFPDLRVVAEPKADEAVLPLVDAVRRAGALDRVCIGSLSDARVRRAREALGPEGCTSMGPSEVRALRLASVRLRRLRSVPSGPQCVQVPPRSGIWPVVDRPMVAAAHRLGLPVHVWTVNEARAMHELLDLGVDGIISDALASLRAVLAERGAWHGG